MKDYDRNKITPILSVVIPTLGRPILVRTLNSLIQTKGFPQLEVLIAGRIASGQVLDEVHRLLAEHPQLRHLPVSFAVGDSSEKKNAGWRASRADLVAFLDDDVVVAADWAQHMLASFDRPEIALVSGPGLVPRDVSWMTRLAGSALASKAAGYVSERYLQGQVRPRAIRWSRIIGCNMVYRKKILEAIGGFDPKFWPGEEMVAAFRTEKAGYQLMFNPEAYVFHYPRQTFGHFIRQIYGYGATRVRLIRSGVDPEPVTLVPALWVLSLAVLGVGGGVLRWDTLDAGRGHRTLFAGGSLDHGVQISGDSTALGSAAVFAGPRHAHQLRSGRVDRVFSSRPRSERPQGMACHIKEMIIGSRCWSCWG